MNHKNPTIAASFMRASNYDEARFGHAISMPKLNGLRCMWIPGAGFFSRDGLKWNDPVLTHIKPGGNRIIDGELYCHGMRLQDITKAVGVTRHEAGPRALEVDLWAFDVVNESKALQRMIDLQESVAQSERVLLCPYKICLTRVDIDDCYRNYELQGYEGQMLKSPYGSYVRQGPTEKPTMNLQRRKAFVDAEFTCVGVELSTEERIKGRVGALVFMARNGKEFNVGTGFTDLERLEWSRSSLVGQRATIKYLYLSADGIPNNSSFVAWREPGT
jgi:DNA ligase-1